MPEKTVLKFTVEYTENEMESFDVTNDTMRSRGHRVVARLRKRCDVVVTIDLRGIIQTMGPKACTNATGVSRDGHVTVRRSGVPEIISREPVER